MSLFKEEEPQFFEIVKGKDLTCPVCGNKKFFQREAQLNKATSTFFGLDWANRSATCLVCSSCTYIYWFLGK
jgi:predicted nucleic-acid-binding Zn-ribbon protein